MFVYNVLAIGVKGNFIPTFTSYLSNGYMFNCKNCNSAIDESALYCSQCGQKRNAHLLTIKELFSNFWSSLFNLDNTLFKTLKYIWAPWKLTEYYVAGKRQSFFNPMRLFLVTLLFHFGYLVSLTSIDNNKIKSNDEYRILERSELYKKFKDEKIEFGDKSQIQPFADSLENRLFDGVLLPEQDTLMQEEIFGKIYPVTRKDAIDLPIDSIYKKYNISTFPEKIAIKQYIKINLDRAGTLKYALGNAAWGLLVAVLLLGWLYKLIYIRHKKYYVEHLVFWMNVHSLLFIIVTLIVFLSRNYFSDEDKMSEFISVSLTILLPLLLYVSIYKYYKQGIFKTFVKFCITSGFYIMIGLTVVSIVSLMSLIFF